MEGRRRNKEKSSVLGYRIILCIYPMCQSSMGGCERPLLQPDRIGGLIIYNCNTSFKTLKTNSGDAKSK